MASGSSGWTEAPGLSGQLCNTMTFALGPEDTRLHAAISEVLHYLWDPIGVAGIPEARDEYDGYVHTVLSLLRADATEAELVNHLVAIESERMGIDRPSEHAMATVGILLRWRAFVSR